MKNLRPTLMALIERASEFQSQGKYSAAIDCLIQAVGILAEPIEVSKPEPQIKQTSKILAFDEEIAKEAFKRNLTDMDTLVIWNLGLAAWDASKKWGAKFPHE